MIVDQFTTYRARLFSFRTTCFAFVLCASMSVPFVEPSPPLFQDSPYPTEFFVDAQRGCDECTGTAPGPCSATCPATGGRGAFQTITKALELCEEPASGPYVIKIAAREVGSVPLVYGQATTEDFPLKVPPRTLLQRDVANSNTGSLQIQGLATGNVIEFVTDPSRGWTNFTSEGGLDGAGEGDAPYGMEIRGGDRTVLLWATAPGETMDIRIESVWLSGDKSSAAGSTDSGVLYNLDVHIEGGAKGAFTVSNSTFSVDRTFWNPAACGSLPAPTSNHTGSALIHVYCVGGTPDLSVLRPRFSNDYFTIEPIPPPLPPSGETWPSVDWGMYVESLPNTDAYVQVTGLTIEGRAQPAPVPGGPPAGGIVMGLEFASNTGNPTASHLIPRFDFRSSSIRTCALFGAAVETGVSTSTVTQVEIAGNTFLGNGVRPEALGLTSTFPSCVPSSTSWYHYVGSGLHLLCRGTPSWFIGSIASNSFNGNVTGVAFSTSSSSPPSWLVNKPVPQGVTVGNNQIWGQVMHDLSPLAAFAVPSDGVGVAIADERAFLPVGPGFIDPGGLILEANQIYENPRHGVWMLLSTDGSSLSPIQRNNRIYGNGTVVPPTFPGWGVVLGDGVRIQALATATGTILGPYVINETIWGNGTASTTTAAYGVNNTAGAASMVSIPRIWNSIIHGNNAAGPDDLFGFNFGTGTPSAAGPTVDYSNFCGGPWTAIGVACDGRLMPLAPHNCISAPPQFFGPTPPGFELTCLGGGSVPPSPCLTPCYTPGTPAGGGSRCIDGATTNAPLYPLLDALGRQRVGLVTAAATPDMGALEKQNCTP